MAGSLMWVVLFGTPKGYIEVSSPFPGRIYFILNLGHFLKLFETLDEIAEKLTWLPTWHQAFLLCEKLGVDPKDVAAIWQTDRALDPGAAYPQSAPTEKPAHRAWNTASPTPTPWIPAPPPPYNPARRRADETQIRVIASTHGGCYRVGSSSRGL